MAPRVTVGAWTVPTRDERIFVFVLALASAEMEPATALSTENLGLAPPRSALWLSYGMDFVYLQYRFDDAMVLANS